MIRQIRRLVIVFFILSVVFCVGTRFYYKINADTTAPEISMNKDSVNISINSKDSAILKHITAKDDQDGDVTDSLMVESLSNFITASTREATIAAFDNAGNVSKTVRTVHYKDYTSPKLNLKGSLIASNTDYADLLSLIKVSDCLDGNISDDVQLVSDDVSSLSNEGDHKMHIQVTNSAGDTLNIPVTVTIYQNQNMTTRAEISLENYVVYLERNAELDPASYLKELTYGTKTFEWDSSENAFVDTEPTDNETGEAVYDSISLSELTIDNTLNTAKDGTYEITYRYNTDTVSGIARLLVIVGGGQ